MVAIVMVLVLATLVPHNPPFTWTAIKPPPFRTGRCTGYAADAPVLRGRPIAFVHVEQNGTAASVAGGVMFFTLDGSTENGHGFLYYRLDDFPGAYLGTLPEQSEQSFAITFEGLTLGPHRLRYGLISHAASNISYGEVCFTVVPGVKRMFYSRPPS